MRGAARWGTAFLVLFVATFVLGLGTLVGAFADPDRVFTERWADGGNRIKDIVAWATVPMSLTFGSWVDDPGLEVGQAVLPQFGYVALSMGAMLPAAAFIVLVARAPGLLSRWLVRVSYPVAVLVAGTALLFMPMFLFLAWVLVVVTTQWSHGAVDDTPGP